MVHYLDNPAGRLHKLLLDLHAAYPNDQQQRAKQAWTAIVDLVGTDAGLAGEMSIVGAVVALPAQIRRAVDALQVDAERKEHLLMHLDGVERGMELVLARQDLHAMFNTFATYGVVPQSAAVSTLSFCSYALHAEAPEATISDEDLTRIIEMINELMAEISEAKLPDLVKRAMLNHLTALLQAAHNVRFAGTGPLDDALFALMGAARRANEQEDLTRAGWWGKFMKVVQTLGTLLSVGQTAAQVGRGIAGFLEG